MNDINSVNITGRLVADSDLHETGAGVPVLNFSIAVNKTRRSRDGELDEVVNFFDVAIYGDRCRWLSIHLSKGTVVAVNGSPEQQRWTSADGRPQSKTAIIASNVRIIDDYRGAGNE